MSPAPPRKAPRARLFGLLWWTRYGIPAIVCAVGVVLWALNPDNLEGSAAIVGAGLSISLLNFLHRFGVQSDRDRAREDAAREYFDRHGYWPDERHRHQQ